MSTYGSVPAGTPITAQDMTPLCTSARLAAVEQGYARLLEGLAAVERERDTLREDLAFARYACLAVERQRDDARAELDQRLNEALMAKLAVEQQLAFARAELASARKELGLLRAATDRNSVQQTETDGGGTDG